MLQHAGMPQSVGRREVAAKTEHRTSCYSVTVAALVDYRTLLLCKQRRKKKSTFRSF
jgi:hypothetical protein